MAASLVFLPDELYFRLVAPRVAPFVEADMEVTTAHSGLCSPAHGDGLPECGVPSGLFSGRCDVTSAIGIFVDGSSQQMSWDEDEIVGLFCKKTGGPNTMPQISHRTYPT